MAHRSPQDVVSPLCCTDATSAVSVSVCQKERESDRKCEEETCRGVGRRLCLCVGGRGEAHRKGTKICVFAARLVDEKAHRQR